ncbi:aqualysin-1-like [Asterias amurensis]|uniref:aqualysin-1-like n=1 Tax=Asterias amurensis TaxID=7602 RepID=UPI003AB28B0B
MKLILLCLCVAAANAALAPIYMAQRRGIPNSFIIKAKDASVLDQVEKDVLAEFQTMRMPAPKVSKISDLIPVLNLPIPPHLINTIRSIDGIEYIEQDSMGELFGQQSNPTWGIDRIDSRDGIDYMYSYNDNVMGNGAKIYIVDTGIRLSHSEFGGRAQRIFGGDDDNSHGTHCAGTAAGATYGIARQSTIYSVKVCNQYGQCPVSTLLNGLNTVATYGRGVVSMSLGFPVTNSIDDAVQQLLDANYVVSVAAGNSNANACNVSPAHVAGALTVGASDRYDRRSYFSNWGSCLDLFAPGSNIESAGISDDYSITTKSGTSMACPHVTGAAALYLGMNPNSNSVANDLLASATTGRIADVSGSPNKFLYIGNL